MNRYKNIFSGVKVTRLQDYTIDEKIDGTTVTNHYVLYRRDTPQIIEWTFGTKTTTEEMYEFVKPLHIFEQSYKEID